MIALVLALSGPPAPTPLPIWQSGRVYTTAGVHVGVRPAVFVDRDEIAFAVTVQVTGRVF